MRNLATMLKPLALSVALLAIFTATQSVARAEQVTFSTAACFGAGCSPLLATATAGSGTANLAFAGQPGTTVDTSLPSGFTVADLGTLTLSGVGTFSSTPFTLQITQTAPSVGTGTFNGTLTGTIIQNGSDVRIVFDQTFVMIGLVRYDLNNLTNGNTLFLDSPATGGVTRISANVSAVPEPATMILLGTGLAGVAARARRRRKAA